MLIDPIEVKLKNGLNVTIKSPQPADAEKILRHLRIVFHEAYRNMNFPKTHWDHFAVVDEEKILSEASSSPNRFMLSAFFEEKIIGNLGLFGSFGEFQKHNARIGMGIEKQFCGIGLGSALLKQALAQAKKINIHRVELMVRSFNQDGIRLYENVGFQKVGTLKDVTFIDGQYYDEFMYQILL